MNEEQIEQLTQQLINAGFFNNLVCMIGSAYPDALIYDCCREVAEKISELGYKSPQQPNAPVQAIEDYKALLFNLAAQKIPPAYSFAAHTVINQAADEVKRKYE